MSAHLTILAPHEYRMQELSAPVQEPVDLDTLKAHLRLSGNAQDSDLATLVMTARQLCEAFTGKALVARTVAVFLDRWPCARSSAWWDGVREGAVAPALQVVRMPVSPVQSVDAIYLHDGQGGARLVPEEKYQFDALGARLSLQDIDFDAVRAMNGIEIRLTAGYGLAAAVPSVYKQAVRLLAAHLYAHRGDEAESALSRCGVAALLAPFREVSLR